jgi:hypothetical protein
MTDRDDRFFDLLPAAIRVGDARRDYPLRDLLRVVGEEAGQLEEDIRRMYENLFIETCEPWVVPYIGDLVGFRPLFVPPGTEDDCDGARRAGLINPRRAVAERVALNRRKGTFSVLDDLAAAATGWAAIVANDRGGDPIVRVRVWRLPSWSLTRIRPYYVPRRTNCFALSVLGNDSPLFTRADPEPDDEELTRSRVVPRRITMEMLRDERDRFYGQDKSLCLYENEHPIAADRIEVQNLSDWSPEVFGTKIAVDPVLGRVMFPERYPRPRRLTASLHYGFPTDMGGGEYPRPLANATVGRSLFRDGHLVDRGAPLLEILRTGGRPFTRFLRGLLTPGFLAAADDDVATLERRLCAELNRIMEAYPLAEGPIADDLPLDEEATALLNDQPRGPRRIRLNRLLLEANYPAEIARSFALVRVTSGTNRPVIMEAVRSLQDDDQPPMTIVVELADSGLYVEPVVLSLPPLHTLELRAAEGCRPTIVLPEQEADIDHMQIDCGYGSEVILDGLMVARRAVLITGNPLAVTVRHCTLVPGWELDEDCEPCCGEEPSLILSDEHGSNQPGEDKRRDDCPPELLVPTEVRVDRSIVGTIVVRRNEVDADPVRLEICRSIVDATERDGIAISAWNDRCAHAVVSVVNSTVIGQVRAHAIELGENSIFTGKIGVARRQIGCLRFSYVPPGSRTPRRHACQPDLVMEAADEDVPGPEAARVEPRFMDQALRYGRPDYCRLDDANCAEEILTGADDESEMGVYHDLYQPQRTKNLQSALSEFLPLGWGLDLEFAT